MSPLQVNILLHYHWSPLNYHEVQEPKHANSQAVAECHEFFVKVGLISTDGIRGFPPAYKITDRGTAMVEHICAVQIPICKWVQP